MLLCTFLIMCVMSVICDEELTAEDSRLEQIIELRAEMVEDAKTIKQQCCVPIGDTCNFTPDCCEGLHCENARCLQTNRTNTGVPIDGKCKNDTLDCVVFKRRMSNIPHCVSDEQICRYDEDCRKSMGCINSKCVNGSNTGLCRKAQEQCTINFDCCPDFLCANSKCVDTHQPPYCIPVNEKCGISKPCCPFLLCMDFKCGRDGRLPLTIQSALERIRTNNYDSWVNNIPSFPPNTIFKKSFWEQDKKFIDTIPFTSFVTSSPLNRIEGSSGSAMGGQLQNFPYFIMALLIKVLIY